IHTQVLDGQIDQSGARAIPAGHPVDTFKKENRELEKVCLKLNLILSTVPAASDAAVEGFLTDIRQHFNLLMDVDKHYRRKENLLFPFLEQHGITGPPKVMWGKHDEVREMLKSSIEALHASGLKINDLEQLAELLLKPAAKAITDMIMKEEEILFPMTMDELTDDEWYEIYQQTNEIGYCLYDPSTEWKPANGGTSLSLKEAAGDGTVRLPSGSFTIDELTVLLNTLPIDVTFVDRNDKVKFFTQGRHRIFDRNRAIIGRDVRMCHPPHSVHVVEQILADFKSGKESSAPFWIQMGPRFIYINYFPLRDAEGNYLGTIEFSQDLTELRTLEGEQRLLSYGK
ncbi:MAG TPA: DUF438 domain-containing protein, partial [Bacteroidales bacterium]|nr:DUF438 domain-containing protein [Bacteroidales bacterium]